MDVNGTVPLVTASEIADDVAGDLDVAQGADSDAHETTKTASKTASKTPPKTSKRPASKRKPTARNGAADDIDAERRPIKMLHDRLLVRLPNDGSERRTSGGILIPATAQQNKRLVWAEVVGAGPNVRSAQEGDRVLFSPDDRHEVEVHGDDFLILRERDVHAIAAPRIEPGSTGLYL